MNNSLNVNVENVQKAFKEAGDNPEIQTLLINLFGKENVEVEQIDNRPITERIKTFEDAINELGEDNPMVVAYWVNEGIDECDNDVISYLKLRIICEALNEEWQPQFTEDEYRYYPWFYLYTQTEIDDMEDDTKQEQHLILTGDYKTRYCGFACAASFNVPSNTNARLGSRLCLKTRELAIYCGKQFVELWANFNLIRK